MSGHSGMEAVAESRLTWIRGHIIGQAAMFTVVGGLTTLVNAVLYMLLRGTFTAEVSNVLSVLITTVASSTAHRQFVFTDRDEHPMRMHLQTVAVFLFYCVSNNVALWLLGLAVDNPSSFAEAVAVSAMALFGGASRFLALRVWVFTRRWKSGQRGVLNGSTSRRVLVQISTRCAAGVPGTSASIETDRPRVLAGSGQPR
ncbi:GtrA family protein [Saccharopolyspora sp. K220]|uniref:GtrA family protein n=1 Tax=Saccharopolyspora soli TaxID=2926618 RepID=UPI001F56ECCB|nr:GtrA family protein [Saccharopolyspora soli]MCI2420890.1 GtrA family protein [Saccharopolyspora soli]